MARAERPALRKVWFFDVQWSDCPEEVHNEVREMWAHYELGNDRYILKWFHKEMKEDYPLTARFLAEHGVDDQEVIIHWWW